MPPPQLTPEDQRCAFACDLAYAASIDSGHTGKFSHNRARTALDGHIERLMAEGNLTGANDLRRFEILGNYCNQDAITIHDRNTNTIIVAFSGSRGSGGGIIRDWIANNIATAWNSHGWRRPGTALELARRVTTDFGSGRIIFTGHSLGGSVAEYASRYTDRSAIVFNIGSGLYNKFFDLFAKNDGWSKNNKVVHHHIKGDFLSALHKGRTCAYDGRPGMWSHSLSNFLPYNRTNYNTNIKASLGGVDFSGAHVHPWPNQSINIGSISGAVFAGSIATLLVSDSSNNSSKITMQDLAVALILAYFGRDPAFSLDPWEVTDPNGPWLRCVYYPERSDNYQDTIAHQQLPFSISETAYGRTMFEADWLLKQLSMGINLDPYSATGPLPSPLPLRTLPSDLINLGLRDTVELGKHRTSSSSLDNNPRYTRFWIVVDQEKSSEGVFPSHEVFSVSDVSCSEQIDMGSSIALRFSDVRLGVQVMRMTRGATGQLEDHSDPRLLEPNSNEVIFARHMSTHYDRIAQHFPPLRRLKELAKLQAVAKWMVENDVEIDIDAALACIQEHITTGIHKVPALERKTDNFRIYGGVDLRVRSGPHDRAPSFFTLAKDVQTELKNMVYSSISTITSVQSCHSSIPLATNVSSKVIPLPFIKKKHCCMCKRPLDFGSLFKPSISFNDAAFCHEHHPETCSRCMLPLYIDPVTHERSHDGSYKSIVVSDSIEYSHDYRYHPTCFLCDKCDKPIDNQKYIKDPDLVHVYYHAYCYSPTSSHIQSDENLGCNITGSNEDASYDEQMNWALLASKRVYEAHQRSDIYNDYPDSSQDLGSIHDHHTNEQHPEILETQIPAHLQSTDEDSQLDEAIRRSLKTAQEESINDAQFQHLCPMCENQFNDQIGLEEHVQLHLDN